MTRKDALWIAFGGLSALGLGYLVYWLNKRPGGVPAAIKSAASSVTKTISGKTTSVCQTQDASFPLKRGSCGRQVVALQLFLNKSNSNNKLNADGNFGPITEAAWKNEQAPFASFKTMFPEAVEGQVSKSYYDRFVYQFDELYGEKGYK
jgi:hypothetical protein